MAKGWTPERTCIACRKKRPRHELVRFALEHGRRLAPDYDGRLQGRGVYLCMEKQCLGLLLKPKSFKKPLRLDSPPRVEPGVYEDVLNVFEINQGGPVARDI